MRQSGLTTPVLLRFPDILKSRVDALFNAFGQAIEKSGYEGDYLCVYPIKVNQQRRVIETISQSYSDKPRLAWKLVPNRNCWPCCPITMSKAR